MTAGPDQDAPGGSPARTVFLGSGSFAVPTLEALVASAAVDVVGVISAPDRPSGRRGAVAPVPVVAMARTLGLPVLQPPRLRSDHAVESFAALAPVVGVLADYGRIVPPAILDLPPHGILNVHPSLLPRHRGAAPIPATILAGDAEAGVTVIRMDAGIDTGPIVAATGWPLNGDETAPELEARAAEEGALLLEASLRRWLAGELEARPQDDSQATLTRPLTRDDGRLDPTAPVERLERQVRAYQPWPGSWVESRVGRLLVWRAEGIPGFEDAGVAVGTFSRFGLRVSDGHLALREVQPAGGRRMTWDELVRGRPQIVGSEAGVPA